jgi:hypothetical protein
MKHETPIPGRGAPDVQRVVRVEQLCALLARRDVDERPAGVQRHPAPRVVSCAPARAVQALQDRRRSAARPHHWDTSYTLPRTTSQQSPGVLCCATSLSEKPLPARTTGGSLRCDALLPSGGMLVLHTLLGGRRRLASCTGSGCMRGAQRSAKSSEGAGFNLGWLIRL